jgi:hypothetical protein
MPGPLATVAFTWDHLAGRYRAELAATDEARAGARAVLDEVRRRELNRRYTTDPLQTLAFADTDVHDEVLVVRDQRRKGLIVGCTRGTPASELATIPDAVREYALDTWTTEELATVGVATRLAVLKEYRKTPAALQLFLLLAREGLKRGYRFCVLTCEPGLVASYRKLGLRPHAPVHAGPQGGFRVPMCLVLHDLDHLQAVGSPLVPVVRATAAGHPDRSWWAGFEDRHPDLDVGVSALHDTSDLPGPLAEGLSQVGRRALAERGLVVTCAAGHRVLANDDGGHWIGVVLAGQVEVRVGDRVVATLGPGEPVGEIAAVLGTRRTADVYALVDGTRLSVLSQSAPERLPSADRERLWKNLARILARRLLDLRDPPGSVAPGSGSR